MQAIGQLKLQAAIQSPKVCGPRPIALTVATSVTMQDMIPEMTKLKAAWAKRAGIIASLFPCHPIERVSSIGARGCVFGTDPPRISAIVNRGE